MITHFQAPNVYVISFVILKEEKNPLLPDCPGPRLGQSGHCVGELEEEIRNKSGQGDRFSLAQIGIISAGYIVRSGSEVLPYYSVTHSSSSSLPWKVLILRSSRAFLNLRAPRACPSGPCDLSYHQDTACKPGEAEVSQGSWFSFRVISTKRTYLPGFMA